MVQSASSRHPYFDPIDARGQVVHDWNKMLGQRYWLGFPPGTPTEQIRARFQARYGCAPQAILERPGCIYAGPIPEVGEG